MRHLPQSFKSQIIRLIEKLFHTLNVKNLKIQIKSEFYAHHFISTNSEPLIHTSLTVDPFLFNTTPKV